MRGGRDDGVRNDPLLGSKDGGGIHEGMDTHMRISQGDTGNR